MKHLLVIFLLVSAVAIPKSDTFKMGESRVTVLSNEDGFFQNTIYDVCSDMNNTLWFATPNSLISYDGYDFLSYYSDGTTNSIPSNIVNSVYHDSFGHLWIATAEGLCNYDISKQKFKTLDNNASSRAIIEKDNNQIWVAYDNVIDVYSAVDLKKERVIKVFEDNTNVITSIEVISSTKTVVATIDGVYSINDDGGQEGNFSVRKLELDDEVEGMSINCLKKDAIFLWVGTCNGLYQCVIDDGHLMVVKSYLSAAYSDDGEGVIVLSLYMDREDKLWVGTQYDGALMFEKETKRFTKYVMNNKHNSALSSNRINAFYEDDFGVMWIGTAQGGINKIDKNEKVFYSYNHSLSDPYSLSANLVNSMFEDNKGYLWISFYESSIVRSVNPLGRLTYKDIKFKPCLKISKSLKSEDVIAIFQDDHGWWWISTQQGVVVYNEDFSVSSPLKLQIDGVPLDLLNARVIEQIDDDRILLGADKVVIVNSPWKALATGQGVEVEPDYLLLGRKRLAEDMVQDDNGNYWLATEEGVVTISVDEKINQIKLWDYGCDDHEMNENHVFTIHKDRYGDLWMGMYGKGIAHVILAPDGSVDSIVSINRQSGLLDDMVYGILEDEEGILWISTDLGICKYNPQLEEFKVYDINDGLPNNNFRRGAYLKSKSGLMLFGGLNGLCVFDSKHIKQNNVPASVFIASLLVNNQTILPDVPYQGRVFIDEAMSQVDELRLDYKSRNISLEVVAHHTASPEKNKLMYMLEGIDKEWIVRDQGKALVNYTNLPAGEFVFKYKAANGDGLWMEDEKQLLIKVIAPWYKRWWSFLLFSSTVLTILYFIINYYLKVENLKSRLELERIDKERLHDIDQAKLRLFTNLSHEFKTPLSLIIAPLEKIIAQSDNVRNKKYISIIQSNIERLQRLIDSLINYRKNESGKIETFYSQTTLGDFINPLLEAFEENIVAKNINFIYNINRPGQRIVIDENKTELVLFNLLSNALKYTRKAGTIDLDAHFDTVNNEEKLIIEVSNDGQGMSEDDMAKIFDRFYRIEEVGNENNGFGIGLAFSKSLIESINGEITVSSKPGVSSSFRLVLPYGNIPSKGEAKSKLPSFFIDDDVDMIEENGNVLIDEELPTILIIDDEADFRRFLFHSFEDKYNVITAKSGEEGIEILKLKELHLVICDVMMPEMSGFQVCKQIKEDITTCHIPVILLTALTTSENEIKGIELGADYYIKKPFSVKQLEIRVQKLIENRNKLKTHYSAKSYLPDDSISMSVTDRNFLKSVNDIIERKMMNSSFGVEELAREANCSTSHFYRRLKQLTGQIPNAYLRNYRLEKASELLSADREITAAEVMYEIGIESPSYFSTSFKKVYGMSPSAYRNKAK